MRSLSGDEISGINRLTSSSSSSSSRLSTPGRTMEDVWKDINLNSLQERPRSREEVGPKGTYRKMMLQEFLARPFGGQQQQERSCSEMSDHRQELNMNMSILAAAAATSDPTPATAFLNLNSSPEHFQYMDPLEQMVPNPHNSPPFPDASAITHQTIETIGSSLCKKRLVDSLDGSLDRRNKRMIKNRESAARSRARKQAYTNELEHEVAHLIEENAKLRKQHQKLVIQAAASAPAPTKLSLHRTSTAPF